MDRGEDCRLFRAEMVREDEVEGGAGLRLVLVVPVGVVPALAGLNLLGSEAEEEEVVLARFLSHLDGGAIPGADGQRAVHHELHVAGAAGFVAGGRDLVRDIAGRDQPLGQA